MGHPINTHNSIVKTVDVARIQNTEQQRDEMQRRQFALTLQEEAAHKQTQVQDSHKAESTQIQREKEKDKRHRKQKKRPRRASQNEEQNSDNDYEHIDLKID